MNELMNMPATYLGGYGPLGNALVGLVILIIGLAIVKFATDFIGRLLKRVEFLNRKNDDGSKTNLVPPILALAKTILTIFVLMAVLQFFGLTDVLAPLKDMVNGFLNAVPNIIGAGIIAYTGWVLAKIVSDLVGIGLEKFDEQLAEKTGNSELKFSKFGSAFILGVVLLPIVVAALGVLDIPAISVPASDMINKLMAAVPNIVGAGVILLVTYYVTRFVVYILTGLLEGMKIDALPKKIGAQGLFSKSFTPTKLVGNTVMFFSMLTATTAAVSMLGIDVISIIFGSLLRFSGGILVGAVILIVGNFLSNMAYEKLSAKGSSGVANIARFAIMGLVLAMGLKAMGLADNIVNLSFGLVLGGIAIAVALAFGLGGRDAAKTVADSWAKKFSK